MSPESDYDAQAARFLLDVLSSCTGPRTLHGEQAETAAATRVGDRSVISDYPRWYRDATSKPVSYDGDNIRAALEAVAAGRDPNMKQREARWIVETIEAARAKGDAALGLPPALRGGGTRGRRQAAHGDVAVRRVPLRIPDATLAVLKERAAKRGESLNLYLVRILDDVASRPEPDSDDAPF